MGTFRLETGPPQAAFPLPSGWEGLGGSVLLHNARWFTQIRWAVVALIAVFGAVAAWAPGLLNAVGIVPPSLWPWVLAATLATINLLIMVLLQRMAPPPARGKVVANIWLQIVADLLVLTVLVYLVGPTDTVIAFAYLFHIALACIFLGRRHSFLVALLSALLFLSAVALQCSGLGAHRSLLSHPSFQPPDFLSSATFAVPTIFVWFVIWYLVSTISCAVRERDRELDVANKRLLQADEDKNLQVLRVTHDLKAPFSGIESNIQILRASHWDEISEPVRQIICKIEARGETLRARVGDILALGNLRSADTSTPAIQEVALRELLSNVILEVQGLAAQRHVSIDLAAEERTVLSDPKQLKILFLNLIANAVSYSHEGQRVEVEVRFEQNARVRVTDHGIGISDQALPHIFEDYYRAKEAARFNPQSTGLGLAIVRQVAHNLRLAVIVSSKPGEETTFEVVLPEERRASRGTNQDH